MSTTAPIVRNPGFAEDIARSFARQGALATIGAVLAGVSPGECRVRLPITDAVSQHHGFVHGGVVGTIADVAGGYAAMTLFDPGREILTIEYKINFLSPAIGAELLAIGRVARSGRTITVTSVEVLAIAADGSERPCALAQTTCMAA